MHQYGYIRMLPVGTFTISWNGAFQSSISLWMWSVSQISKDVDNNFCILLLRFVWDLNPHTPISWADALPMCDQSGLSGYLTIQITPTRQHNSNSWHEFIFIIIHKKIFYHNKCPWTPKLRPCYCISKWNSVIKYSIFLLCP